MTSLKSSAFRANVETAYPVLSGIVAFLIGVCLSGSWTLEDLSNAITAVLSVSSVMVGFQTVAMTLIFNLEKVRGYLRRRNQYDKFIDFMAMSLRWGYAAIFVGLLVLALGKGLGEALPDSLSVQQTAIRLEAGIVFGVSTVFVLATHRMTHVWFQAVRAESDLMDQPTFSGDSVPLLKEAPKKPDVPNGKEPPSG